MMSEETKYECPECGTSVAENETKCSGCGAVFEESADEAVKEPEAAVVTAEKVEDEGGEPVTEAEKVDTNEADSVEEEKKEDEGTHDKTEERPPATEPKNAGLNKIGIVIALLGGLGVVGAALLDALINILDSNHPADINIGPTQMLGIAAAAIVLAVGIVVTFAMRRGK
jgi:DNA-directed RNA polymerase subunit RPC12/RpoP